MDFKQHFCHSASLHFTAKVLLKNHRLSQRYVRQSVLVCATLKVRKSKTGNFLGMNVFGFYASASACAVAVWRMQKFHWVCVFIGFIRKGSKQISSYVLLKYCCYSWLFFALLFHLRVKSNRALRVLFCISRKSKSSLPASAKSSQKNYHVTRRSSTAHFVCSTGCKSLFCGFAAQKFSTKNQLTTCGWA